MKKRRLLNWIVFIFLLILSTSYIGSYLYFRAKCLEDRYVPGHWRSSLMMRSVRNYSWYENRNSTALLRKIYKPKVSRPLFLPPGSAMARPSASSTKFRDPHLYLPQRIEEGLHMVYSPIQSFDAWVNGWAVGFHPNKP